MAIAISVGPLLTTATSSGDSRATGEWTESSGNLPSSGTYFGVCFGHVNGDGNLDLVASADGDGLRVFLGNGAGRWTPAPLHPAMKGGYSGVDLGDFDGDGRMDIIAGSPGVETSTPTGIRVFKGDGAGAFTDVSGSTDLPDSGNWRGVTVGDLNHDGRMDIAASSGYGSSDGVHVFIGDGDGTFTDQSSGLPQSQDRDSNVVLADFNGDGDLDLAVGGSSGADVFLGNGGEGGSMSWTSASVGLPNTRFAGVSAADLDGDGLVDLVMTAVEAGLTGGIYAYRNMRDASLWVSMSTGLPKSGDYIGNGVADLNGDGNMDIVATGGFETTFGLHVYEGNGEGTWSESSPGLPDTGYYVGMDIGDVDGEGNPDIVAGKMSAGGGVEVWMNPRGPPPGLSARLRSPEGGASLTGGSHHRARWSISSGAPPYTIKLSYSTDGGLTYPHPIASGIAQTEAGDGGYEWTVPTLDETHVRLRVDVTDAGPVSTFATSQEDIEIDSTAPSVIRTVPAEGETGVPTGTPVVIEFGEMMNTSTKDAVSISGPGNPSLRKPTWNASVLSFQTSGLEPESQYTVTVSTAAADDSRPGNRLETAHVLTFTTGLPEDREPPVADGGADRTVDQHSQVTFDGTASTDDIGVVNWTWRFYYEGRLVELHGSVVPFIFDIVGTYEVVLKVLDAAKRSDVASLEVRVRDADPPVAVFEPPNDVSEGDEVTLDGTASYDNVGIVGWNWTVSGGDTTRTLEGPIVSHTFRRPGDYQVTLTVVDAEGQSASETLTVHVAELIVDLNYWMYVWIIVVVVVVAAVVLWWRR